jgi:hypothetical protein
VSQYGASWTRTPHTDTLVHTIQFPIVFVAMLVSTVPMSILGAHFAMGVRPFWSPAQYSESSDVVSTSRS